MITAFWSQNTATLFAELGSNPNGLTNQEANAILLKSGKNKKPDSPLTKDIKLFLSQFKSPLMLLLIGAVILSAFLGDTSDVFIILFIVLSTGLLGFFQERNAGKVVEKLQSMVTLKCSVLRDGITSSIPSENIVPGDVLLLKSGDIVPADCFLLEANELQTNEASLTGESFPVKKETGILEEKTELSKRINTLWEGSSVVSGSAKALVVATGSNTVFGKIANSVSATSETSFEKDIKQFGFFLMKISLILCVFILVVNLANKKDIFESALFALALAVGMTPELLPAITTLAMSAGAKRMLEKKVIIRELPSIHNLGEINLLCTDKTGTITEGTIRVKNILNPEGKEDNFIQELAYWNAQLQTGYENPIDDALKQITINPAFTPKKIAEIPYDFNRKRLSVAMEFNTEKWLVSKGAFDQIFSVCNAIYTGNNNAEAINENNRAKIEQQYQQFGENGLRIIALSYKKIDAVAINKEDETEMIFAGFIVLEDAIKPDIIQTIGELNKLQINLKIITGDNKNVAKAIALQLGIANPVVMTGQEVTEMPETELIQKIQDVHIFAEVEPQVKEQIVRTLRNKNIVAYIGDGINDVAAINAADVGISVNNAVDVAREAADFVLMEKNLMVLIDGIKEGRKTFANTLKYIFINTGSTFGNMFSIAFASLLLPFLPMLPKQILLTNFITDFPYLSISNDNVDDEQIEKPGKWDIRLLRNYMVIFGIHSSLFDIITFLTLFYYFKAKESSFQTGWFIESILTELFILFIIRTHKNFFKSKPDRYLTILSIAALFVTVGLPYTPWAQEAGLIPIPLFNLSIMLLIVFLYIVTADILKVWFFKKYKSGL